MAFYSPDAAMGHRLEALVQRFGTAAGTGQAQGLSITWVRYPHSLLPPASASQASRGPGAAALSGAGEIPAGRGASWQGGALQDPGDLVQLVYLAAAERWLQRDLLAEEPELRRALEAMARHGSHDATAHVVDCLSGTTGGPSLASHRRETWLTQRRLVNGWLASLGWPELEGCQALQKTWQEGPYGREHDSFGAEGEHANRFSSDALARLLEAVMAGTLVSPPACQRMRTLLSDPLLHPWLLQPCAAELPDPGRFWGRAGLSGPGVQLALHVEPEAGPATLLVLLLGGEWMARTAEPALCDLLGELLSGDPLHAGG